MSHRHVICLVVDGLRASALGTYGNTTFPTPQFDSLAGRALVADWMWADSPHLAGFYRSVWQGVHALRPDGAGLTILDRFQQANLRQGLVTDDPWLSEQASQLPFDDTCLLDRLDQGNTELAVETLEETALARFFSAAIERLHRWRDEVTGTHSMLWLHSRGLMGPWDAPRELRSNLLDDEDPPPADFVEPPSALHQVDDPDVLLAHRIAYAAQVTVLDACVGAFVEAVEEVFADCEALMLVTSSRGFALGEHGSIGTQCAQLYSEQLHLPWLLTPCGNSPPLPRLQTLSQPADIGVTLADWYNLQETLEHHDGSSCLPLLAGEACRQRQLAIAVGDEGEKSIRTPAWMLRKMPTAAGGNFSSEVFTKPDDYWERNDVVGLCAEAVLGLQQELACAEKCCAAGESLPFVPKDNDLIVTQQ